jgi:hypothetical protein
MTRRFAEHRKIGKRLGQDWRSGLAAFAILEGCILSKNARRWGSD